MKLINTNFKVNPSFSVKWSLFKKRFSYLNFLSCTFLSFIMSSLGKAQQPAQKPNVVFILADDLGWTDLGYMGSKVYESPNVDRLASEGMSFTQFYSGGPVSSPSRAAIMTGKACARTGITGVLARPDLDPEYLTHQLELSEFTIGEAFLKNHYTTGYFGKWHLGYKMRDWAANQGFQTTIGGSTSYNDWIECYTTLVDLSGLPLKPAQNVYGLSFKSILTGESKNINWNAIY
jgi:hypothetical protein